MRLLLGVILLCLPACVTTGVHEMQNGNLRVQCAEEQSECMRQAEMHCAKHGGVQVLSAREQNDLYGVEGNKAGTLLSEVIFVCGDDAPRKPIKLPPKKDEAKPRSTAEPTKRICIPGSTQRCVGPGACVGGQACRPGGVGWAPCECSAAGPASAPPSASASAATDAPPPPTASGEIPAPAPPSANAPEDPRSP